DWLNSERLFSSFVVALREPWVTPMKIAAYLIEKIGSTVSGYFHPSLWLSESHELLVAERLNRIEPRRFDRRIHSKKQAHAHRHGDRQHDGPERNIGGQGRHRQIDQQADACAEQHADDASRPGQHDRFGEELPDDVAAPRSNCFAHAN